MATELWEVKFRQLQRPLIGNLDPEHLSLAPSLAATLGTQCG